MRGWCDLNFHTFFRFGDVSTDAESTARKLISVTSELDSTGAQVLQKNQVIQKAISILIVFYLTCTA